MTVITTQVDENPAVKRKDWLPFDTQFEEVNDLHEMHVALLEELHAIGHERFLLEEGYKAEDEGDAKKRTPGSKRADALDEINHRAKRKQTEFGEFISEAVATIQEHTDEWCDVLREGELKTAQLVEDLRQQLRAAEAVTAGTSDLRTWIERTAKDEQGRHLHWGWYLDKPTTDMLAIANEGRSRANSRPSTHLQREMEAATSPNALPDYSDETQDYASREYQNQLDEAIREHAQKRLAGDTGGI